MYLLPTYDYNNTISTLRTRHTPYFHIDGTSDEAETRVKVSGQYPLKAIGERNQNLLSEAAHLNATISCPAGPSRIGSTTPNNVLNITMHGLYNPSLSGHRRHTRGSDTTCSAILHVPSAIDSVIIIN